MRLMWWGRDGYIYGSELSFLYYIFTINIFSNVLQKDCTGEGDNAGGKFIGTALKTIISYRIRCQDITNEQKETTTEKQHISPYTCNHHGHPSKCKKLQLRPWKEYEWIEKQQSLFSSKEKVIQWHRNMHRMQLIEMSTAAI